MEVVKTLLRYVTRGFCDLKSILIMDALLIHGVLTDEELWHMLGINKKELRALCSKLKEDHLLTDQVQREEGPTQRPITKTYYYIHYTETIDAIKWKMHSIVNKLKEQVGAESQPQGYVCDTCRTRYTTIDVVRTFNPDRGGFVCDVCDSMLREDDSSAESQAQQEKLGRLMSQIEPIIDALRQIDEVHIPENTFQSSLAHALPAPSSSGPNATTNVSTSIKFAKGASQGANGASAASLQVNITSDKESIEIERKNKEVKARLAEENALPTWHLESTVGKTLYDSTSSAGSSNDKSTSSNATSVVVSDRSAIKLEDVEMSGVDSKADSTAATTIEDASAEDKANEDALAAYYAQLAARQEDSDEEEDDDDDDEEEDDDAEFEDVITTDAPASNPNEDDDEDEE